MDPKVKNVLSVIAGIIVGMIINSGMISISGSIIPPPEGVDPNDMESINENIHLYSPKHFIMPWVAHALGSLSGGFTTARLSNSNHLRLSLFTGAFFLLGGVAATVLIKAPIWMTIADLLLAYIPMAWLGWKITGKPADVN